MNYDPETDDKLEPVELDLYWRVETDLAYGVAEGNRLQDQTIWLPKSQVEIMDDAQISEICTFLVPEWLAIEKGLI